MQAALPSLWEKALETLPDEDKKQLRPQRGETRARPSEVVRAVEERKRDCEKKQWVLYTNASGEKVLVRDTLNRVCDWLDKFKQVGDAAVQFDPSVAALPWMGVRLLLQTAVNDCQTFGTMLDGIETVSGIVTRYTELEAKVLIRTSNLTRQLSVALVKLYGSALRFLAHASRYYGQSTLRRVLKSTINTSKLAVDEPILRIEKQEDEVYKLVRLVQAEVTGVRLDDIVRSIKQSVESSHASSEERRKRLSSWIGGVDTKNTYETALQYHHEGTCEWVVELPEFRAWHSGKSPGSRLLWLHGPAGFGKTFLTAWIIRYLEQQGQSSLSYFFCVADNQLTRDPYAILRSWLAQVLDQDERVASVMDAVYKARNNEQTLTQLGLWELFVAVGEAIEGCTFVIDGFDECTDIDTGARYHRNDPRGLFLCDLLKSLKKTKSRVMVVSRDVPDIREYLGEEFSGETQEIDRREYGITAKDTTEDVRSFSEFVINKKLSRKKMTLRQEIASQAAERSEGMFLWIKLLEQEISPGQNAKQLSRTVNEMPSGISDAYSRELEKIVRMPPEEKEKAVMILRWTLFAVRPLQVKQLAEALVVSDEHLDEYPEDDLPDPWYDGFVDEDYVKEMVLGRCGSLLQLRASSSDTPLADHTVHFVHFSVKEYLFNLSATSTTNQWAAELGLADAMVEEVRLSNICLRYLTLRMFEDIPQDTHMYPFLSYAAWAWYFHSFHEKPAPSQDIMHRTQRAFDPATSSWKVWTPLMEAELTESDTYDWNFGVMSVSDTASEGEPPSKTRTASQVSDQAILQEVPTPIYFASLLGLIDVVKWLEDQGLDCNSLGGRFGCPLQAAVARNHEDLVKHLLNRHVDICQAGGEFGAPIIAAAAMSTPQIVRILLDARADVAVTDESGWTALHHAAKRGSAEIVRQLLDYGADINVVANCWTATTLACFYERAGVLLVLAQRGAEMIGYMGVGELALKVAIVREENSLVDLLLSIGVSVNAIFPDGTIALNRAVGSPRMVRKLLEKGADPNMADTEGWTPLEVATASGSLEIVKTLIGAGARVSGCPGSNAYEHVSSPLHIAVVDNNLAIAMLLFQHGADLDQKTTANATPILVAITTRNFAMLEWLLEMGASMQCVWEDTQDSLFDIAARDIDPDPDILRLLVRRGCFQIQTHSGGAQARGLTASQALDDNSLVMLVYDGDIQGVSDALAAESASLPAHVLGEALQVASVLGRLSIVEMLLRHRAGVNFTDMNGRTALHHATKHIHSEVADLLIEHGASSSVEDIIGSTPIDLAILHGKLSARFIRSNMDSFTGDVSRAQPPAAMSPNQVPNLTVMAFRKALSGSWAGNYQYLSWRENDEEPFSIDVPAEPPLGARPSAFFHENTDVVGSFQFCGFVDPAGVVWFVKLYDSFGWLYRGQLDADKGIIRGTWGRNTKLWCGTFQLRKSRGC